MSKEKKISEMENKKEQFVALAKEVYPLIEQDVYKRQALHPEVLFFYTISVEQSF